MINRLYGSYPKCPQKAEHVDGLVKAAHDMLAFVDHDREHKGWAIMLHLYKTLVRSHFVAF